MTSTSTSPTTTTTVTITRPQRSIRKWWKEGICYQIWPLSFKDSSNTGTGDLQGIIGKLDYLRHDLGVDYIWMSPMYTSPRDDYGYDIADYESPDPTFGTLQDMDELIAGCKARGMRLVLDLVVNHTSDRHRWFQGSRKSKAADNEFRDYYIWRDPKVTEVTDENGNKVTRKSEPNNWRAFPGGSAWKYVESRDQYYLHMFLESMPDLNWELEHVRKAIYTSAIEFWLARGVSGFRVDVVNLYSKDWSFPDAPVVDKTEKFQPTPRKLVFNGPRMHEFLTEQREQVLNKFGEDVILIGELAASTSEDMERYVDPTRRELDVFFDFALFEATALDQSKPFYEWEDKRSLSTLRESLMKPQSYISDRGWWATTFFENHDRSRSIDFFGSSRPENKTKAAKLLALMLASMSGTLFIYQGQEIGMSNIPRDWDRSELKDPFLIRWLDDCFAKYPDDPEKQAIAMEIFQCVGRDHARTPVQWTDSDDPVAGFSATTAKPWIRVNENYKSGINVASQLSQDDNSPESQSLLVFWKHVLAFRKRYPSIMTYGTTEFVDNDNADVFSVVKHATNPLAAESVTTGEGEVTNVKKSLVVMNYSDHVQKFPSTGNLGSVKSDTGNGLDEAGWKYVFGTKTSDDIGAGEKLTERQLEPWEGRVFALD